MSPTQRLAWAALLPGVTYNTGDKTDLKKKKQQVLSNNNFGLQPEVWKQVLQTELNTIVTFITR